MVDGLHSLRFTGLEWVRAADHDHADEEHWGPLFGYPVFVPFVRPDTTPRVSAEERASEQAGKLARLAGGLTTIVVVLVVLGIWVGTIGWALWATAGLLALVVWYFRWKSAGLLLDVERNRKTCDPKPVVHPPPLPVDD